MKELSGFLQQVQTHIVEWATGRDEIRALLLAGSYARSVYPADEYSDLDLEFFVTDCDVFFKDTLWVEQFGNIWTYLDFQTADADPQRLVLFEDGYKVDFTFFTVDALQAMVEGAYLYDSQARGYRVLLDKDDLAQQLPAPLDAPLPFTPPTADEYDALVNAFWYTAVYFAKQIRRRNMWVVKYRDWTLKTQLLRMIEWHAHATHAEPVDTWHDGHFMERWVDATTWQEIGESFGRFGAPDSWWALANTMDLFRRLAGETADVFGFSYPLQLDAQATQYVRVLRTSDVGTGL